MRFPQANFNGIDDNQEVFTITRPSQEFSWYTKRKRQLESKWTLLLLIAVLISLTLSIILIGICLKFGPVVFNVNSWQTTMVKSLKAIERKLKERQHWNQSKSTPPKKNESRIDDGSERIDRVCVTMECVKRANSIINKLDESVKPCEDFYQFACGGWIKSNPISSWLSSISIFGQVHQLPIAQLKALIESKASPNDSRIANVTKQYYRMCMKQESDTNTSDTSLQKVLQEFGDWPMASNRSWTNESFDWIDATIKLREMGLSNYALIKIHPIVDVNNSSMYRIGIQEPSLNIGRDYLVKNDTVAQLYRNYIEEVAILYGGKKEGITDEVRKAFEFERELALITIPKEEIRETTGLYISMKLSDLDILAPSIPWNKLISKLFQREFKGDQQLLVKNIGGFITKFEMLVNRTDERTLANFVAWSVTRTILPYLGPKYNKLETKFVNKVLNKTDHTIRWHHCLNSVSTFLGLPLQSLYAKQYGSKKVKDSVTKIAKQIEEAFNDTLKSSKWMDKATRTAAMDKLVHLNMIIAYPEELLNITSISTMFDQMQFNESSNYLENTLFISQWYTDGLMAKADKPHKRTDWTKNQRVSDTNAYYSMLDNALILPVGLLLGDFFAVHIPDYLNFGSVGFIAGHEITHGFDDVGRQFDAHGNKKNWWSPKTDEYFVEHANCIVNQYSNYHVINGKKLDGQFSLGENIADNGGVKVAYKAYKYRVKKYGVEPMLPGLKYSSEQLFFLSFAQLWCTNYSNRTLDQMIQSNPHVPAKFRVIGPLSNNEDFARTFKCPIGSPMNPSNKCTLW